MFRDGRRKKQLIALELLGQKYSANYREKTATSISKQWNAVSVVEIVVEHMSGKEAIELVAMS